MKEYCQSCKFWYLWRYNKNGKGILGCRIGQKPTGRGNNTYCRWRKDEEKIYQTPQIDFMP